MIMRSVAFSFNSVFIYSFALFQVIVFVNNIPATCQNQSCSYNYSRDETPTISSISPTSGFGGLPCKQLQVTCQGCGVNASAISVSIGLSNCVVTDLNGAVITCCPTESAAGSKEVTVHVAGKGISQPLNGQHLYFRYLVNVSSISPSQGSISGGLDVTINGFGFGSNRDDVKVLLGNATCLVNQVNMTTIVCSAEDHVQGTVDVKVEIITS